MTNLTNKTNSVGSGELYNSIRECIKQDPNYNEILNLTGDMGIYDIESRIISIITNQKLSLLAELEEKAVTFARPKTYTVVMNEAGDTEERAGHEFIQAIPISVIKSKEEELK